MRADPSTPGSTDAGRPAPKSRPGRLAQGIRSGLAAATEAGRGLRTRHPRLVALARLLVYVGALVVVAVMGYLASRDVQVSRLRAWPILGGLGAAMVWWACLAAGWALLVDGSSRYGAMASWCRTQVARYVPGGIWALAARATTVEGRLRDKVGMVTAENVTVLLTALAVGGAWAAVHDPRWLPLVMVTLVPVVGSSWLARHTTLSRRGVRRAAASYAVGFVGYGVLAMLVQYAVSGGQGTGRSLYVAGAACLAWAVGLVVWFAPGGIGIREVVYVALLAGLYPRSQLEAAAVASRLVTVVAELLTLAVVARPVAPRARSAGRGQ